MDGFSYSAAVTTATAASGAAADNEDAGAHRVPPWNWRQVQGMFCVHVWYLLDSNARYDGIFLEFHEVFDHGDRDDNIMNCISLYIPPKASLCLTASPGEAQYYNSMQRLVVVVDMTRHGCVIK
jgi:hypothetical protein